MAYRLSVTYIISVTVKLTGRMCLHAGCLYSVTIRSRDWST